MNVVEHIAVRGGARDGRIEAADYEKLAKKVDNARAARPGEHRS